MDLIALPARIDDPLANRELSDDDLAVVVGGLFRTWTEDGEERAPLTKEGAPLIR